MDSRAVGGQAGAKGGAHGGASQLLEVDVPKFKVTVGQYNGCGGVGCFNEKVVIEVGPGFQLVKPAAKYLEGVRHLGVEVHLVRVSGRELCTGYEVADGSKVSQEGDCACD